MIEPESLVEVSGGYTAEDFQRELQRYIAGRKAARVLREAVDNLNAALKVAASLGVRVQLEGCDRFGSSDVLVCPSYVRVECMQETTANVPADWVLNMMQAAVEIVVTEGAEHGIVASEE